MSRGLWRRNAWRVPLAAWVLSRAVGVLGLVVTPTPEGRWFTSAGLTTMDGNWFSIIALIGYPNDATGNLSPAWAFFPFFPWLADLPTKLGVSVDLSLVAVSWLAALAALVGLWRLVASRFSERAAALAVGLVALQPGAIGLVLSYSDSLFLAAAVWAFVLVDEMAPRADGLPARSQPTLLRWCGVGLLAAAATASRPNGFLIVVVVLVALWQFDRRVTAAALVALPSAVFLSAWMFYCWRKSGDPLVFLSAKGNWDEWSLWRFVTHPFARPAQQVHVATWALMTAIAVPSLRRLPPWWNLSIVLFVVPQLALGVEGLARYVELAFPLSIAAALTLEKRRLWIQALALGVAAASMLYLAVRVSRYGWVP